MIAYIGVGTNIGNLIENVVQAIDYLKKNENITEIFVSSLYETEPVGFKEQPDFINAVFFIKTKYLVHELFKFLKDVEKKMGRQKTVKYGPRIIDLDILFYNNLVYQDVDITVPHPQLHKRSFVIFPLYELNKDFIHPLFLKNIEKLKMEMKDYGKIQVYAQKNFPGRFK